MDDWTRVLLYGTFDGFAYSTDDFPRTVVVLDSGERVEVPEECVVSADRMVNKNKIKLKDVIARIKELDLSTQKVWLNEILNELGSDYGTLKYKVGYEQGKFDGAMEREKVTVPQFVADWINSVKTNGLKFKNTYGFYEEIKPSDDVYRVIYYIFKESIADKEIRIWVDENTDTFARAWLDGYTVEKEKRYLVKMKGVGSECFLNHNLQNDSWLIYTEDNCKTIRTHHTRKELEEAGFGEVFNSPLFEVEEVEE